MGDAFSVARQVSLKPVLGDVHFFVVLPFKIPSLCVRVRYGGPDHDTVLLTFLPRSY